MFHTLICKFDQWDRCFLNHVLESLELQVSTPRTRSNFRPDLRVDFSPCYIFAVPRPAAD